MARDPRPPGFPPPRKRLGQHFLSDPRILARIADALELSGTDTVIEIGPGRGALTEELVRRAGRVIAIELDRALAARLREQYADRAQVTIIERDVLDVDFGEVADGDVALVGNVPYYITTPILFKALDAPRASRAVFLVQREVAERLAAPPGTRAYGALTVNVRAVADVELMFRVAAGAFHPPPKVESAVVRIRPRPHPVIAPDEERRFRAFIQAAFARRRKQMRRVLRAITGLEASDAEAVLARCGIAPEARPETLAPEAFADVLRVVRARDRRAADRRSTGG